MWWLDGIPASHPTLSLVIYNHKIKTILQRQGQFMINTYEIDPSTTIATIFDAICDDDITIQTENYWKQLIFMTEISLELYHTGRELIIILKPLISTIPMWINKKFLFFIMEVWLNIVSILFETYCPFIQKKTLV